MPPTTMVLPSGERLKALSRPTALGAAASRVNVFASQARTLSGSSLAELFSWSERPPDDGALVLVPGAGVERRRRPTCPRAGHPAAERVSVCACY